jgi:translation initiation factor IF-1
MGSYGKSRKRQAITHDYNPELMYFENCKIIEMLAGTRFRVKVDRSDKGKPDLIIECDLKTVFKLKRIKLIKGDRVTVEVDPTQDFSATILKGTIVLVQRDNYIPPSKVI